MSDLVLALDVGGTQIRAALCDRSGAIHARMAVPTAGREGTEAVMNRIEHALREVWLPQADAGAIGVSAPGPLDPWTGVVFRCHNIPGWDDYPLAEILRRRLGLPVVVGDDANLAALAEQRYGAGRGHDNLIYLTISTGVGSGIVVDGRLLLGARGIGAEAGCMIVDAGGPPCPSGSHRGCLESLVSGPAIARRMRERIARGERSSLVATPGGLGEITAHEVAEAAQAGDPLATDVLREAGVYLGLGLVSLLHLFNPEVIVVGGSVCKAGALLLEPAREVVRQQCLTDRYWRELSMVPAALGDDVALVGAAALAWDYLQGVTPARVPHDRASSAGKEIA